MEVERLCQGLTSNTVLEYLCVNLNSGFGSDFGCQQLSNVLASSISLEALVMWSVGMKGTGLSQLLGTLLASGQSQLQVLGVGANPECLADYDEGSTAAELLAQLLAGHAGTTCRLRELWISGIGLSVAGANRPCAGSILPPKTPLRRSKTGRDPILKTIVSSSLVILAELILASLLRGRARPGGSGLQQKCCVPT